MDMLTTTGEGSPNFHDMRLDCACGSCLSTRDAFRQQAADQVLKTLNGDTIPANTGTPFTVAPGETFTGAIGPTNADFDLIALDVEAGKTYALSLNAAGDSPMEDPYLVVYRLDATTNQLVMVTADDEGGTGANAFANLTATSTERLYVLARSYPGGAPGTYELSAGIMGETDDVPFTLPGAAALEIGETKLGFIETLSDRDLYKVRLEAGQYYEFEASGGSDYIDGRTGGFATDVQLILRDSNGTIISGVGSNSSSDRNASLSFVATQTGDFYLDVAGGRRPTTGDPAGVRYTGGYEIAARTRDLSTLNPLDSINWGGTDNVVPGAADGVIKVYFAKSGEVFDGVTSLGWNAYEVQQAMLALEQYEDIIDVEYAITDDAADADFKLVTTNGSTGVLGYFRPPGEANAGVGVFWKDGFGWDENGEGGLEQGGFGFITLIHEFGHAMGLSHPHDNGGGSAIMAGVFGPFGQFGAYGLNQGVFTTMSYNDGLSTSPADPNGLFGHQGTMMGFDVALLQQKYGANTDHNADDTVYTLNASNAPGTYFSTIWDTGGEDTIEFRGSQSAVIDLTAATLDYSRTGAGALSLVDGVAGGFTIANGVVIENARGGSGADLLIGNAADNELRGGAGADRLQGGAGDDELFGGMADDFLVGGDGLDRLTGGEGNDTFLGEIGETTVRLRKFGDASVDIIVDFDGFGDDRIDLRGLDADSRTEADDAFDFVGKSKNTDVGDLFFRSYSNVRSAQAILGLDLGDDDVDGPVTVVFGDVDGDGAVDFALVLLNTRSVDASDFLL